MNTDIRSNRRINPDGMKGHTDVTTGTEHEEGRAGSIIGRRKFLILGGAGAAVLAGTAGAARALIVAGGPNPSPRSQDPVGLDPGIGRSPDALGRTGRWRLPPRAGRHRRLGLLPLR